MDRGGLEVSGFFGLEIVSAIIWFVSKGEESRQRIGNECHQRIFNE